MRPIRRMTTPASKPKSTRAAKTEKAAPGPGPVPVPDTGVVPCPARGPTSVPAPAGEKPAPTSETPASEEKKTRIQLASVLHISISQARCGAHLKQNLSDEQVEEKIRVLRQEKERLEKEPAGAAAAEVLKQKISDLSKGLVRMSSKTPIATAVVMDALVKELIRHGMDRAAAAERKVVEVANLHEAAAGLVYYPLVNKLPAFAGYNPEHEEDLRRRRATKNKAAKEAREAKKGGAPEAGAREPKGEEDSEGGGEHPKTTFHTYVETALKAVKQAEPYSSMRVSNRVREYLSQLLAEAITRLAVLSRIIVQQVMGVRTMDADHVKAIIHVLMVDEGRGEAQIEDVKRLIDEKLALYEEHMRREKDKKAALQAGEKKAETEHKRLEGQFTRKKKLAETARRRALAATAKAEGFEAEAKGLEAQLVPAV
jgi:hypothetical protein